MEKEINNKISKLNEQYILLEEQNQKIASEIQKYNDKANKLKNINLNLKNKLFELEYENLISQMNALSLN
jgi:hypothetical protein